MRLAADLLHRKQQTYVSSDTLAVNQSITILSFEKVCERPAVPLVTPLHFGHPIVHPLLNQKQACALLPDKL